VREAGLFFAVPTYLFVGTLLITIVVGVVRVLLSAGHPTPVAPLAPPPPARIRQLLAPSEGFRQRLHGIDGVEAVSNGVKAFREPAVKTRTTHPPP